MRFLPGLIFVLTVADVAAIAVAAEPGFVNPLIKDFGAIAVQPDAAELPRKGVRIVFDVTSESKPGEVVKGLESVARYLNLNAQAGNSPSDIRLALVVHGGATKAALTDSGYAAATGGATNPNLALVRELKKHGVEVFVCGQSLARNKLSLADVAPEFKVAASAMTVNVNKQQVGFAYVSLH